MRDSFPYLNLDEVKAMQRALIDRYGGLHGIRDEGALESSLAQPEQNVFGEERYPDVFQKAAAYAFYLAKNHPFIDGNKRIALGSAMVFLGKCGYVLLLTDPAPADCILGLISDEIKLEDFAEILERNSLRHSES